MWPLLYPRISSENKYWASQIVPLPIPIKNRSVFLEIISTTSSGTISISAAKAPDSFSISSSLSILFASLVFFPKAFGKNTKEANKILRELDILKESGAFAAEIEIVPEEVVEIISKKTDLFLIGMGSGTICDAQYLFSEDILGYNNGHIPRHAKTYTNLKKNYDDIKNKSINAYKLFVNDVRNKKYPNKKHHIKIDKKELNKIKDDLN